MRAAMVACNVAGHTDVSHVRAAGVSAAVALEHTPLGEFAHDLLGEERITGGPLGDRLAQACNGGVRTEQLRDQCRSLRITQRCKGYGLSTGHPAQRALDIRGGR